MNYLLVQIFLCLLIAGLIGLVIGWLLSKLAYKVKLLENEELKEKELFNISSEYERSVKLLNDKLQRTELSSSELKRDLENKIAQNNSSWDSKVQSLLGDSTKVKRELDSLNVELDRSENQVKILKLTLDEKQNSWENKVNILRKENQEKSKELAFLETTLKKSKAIESELRTNLNELERKSKLKELTTENNNKEIMTLETDLKKAKTELKLQELTLLESKKHIKELISQRDSSSQEIIGLKSDLDKSKARIKEFKLKFSDADNKVQGLMTLNNTQEIEKKEIENHLKNLELEEDKSTLESDKITLLKKNLMEAKRNAKDIENRLQAKLDECMSNSEKRLSELKENYSKKENIEVPKLLSEKIEIADTETVVKITKVDRTTKHQVKGMKRAKKIRKNLMHKEEIQLVKNRPTKISIDVNQKES